MQSGGKITVAKAGIVLTLLGLALSLAQWASNALGIQLGPSVGYTLLVLSIVSVIVGLAILSWSWLGGLWAEVKGFRRHSWLIGGPIAFGVLLGGMEWLISTSVYYAFGVGIAAYALAQLSFRVWAGRLIQTRKRVQELLTTKRSLEEESRKLRESRDSQLRLRCHRLYEDLDRFLEGWEWEDHQNQGAMYEYKQRFSGEVASVINDLKHFGLWKPKVEDPERLQFPESRHDIQSLSGYLCWVASGFPI